MQEGLILNEAGIRRLYNVQSKNGTWYKVELNNRDNGWKWQVLDAQTNDRLGSFPTDIHEWADDKVHQLRCKLA